MLRPRNLISDSTLVQETLELARARAGRVTVTEIADTVFRLGNTTPELAAALVTDLVQNDPRFSIEGNYLAIKETDVESQLLNEIDFVVVDVEAIGGRGVTPRIIEIGAHRVRQGRMTDEFQTLINPEQPLPRFVSELTGITTEMLEHAPRFPDVVHSWLDFAGDSVLVAHNSSFDVSLLNQEIGRVFPGCRMANAELCTVQISRRVAPFLDNHHLDALADHFGFEITQRHRAAADAQATARVLLHLLDEFEIRGVRTLAEARDFRVAAQPNVPELELAFDS